jgi:NADH dehydrogenase
MNSQPLDLVTGAFGYTGSRIAERLLADGRRVVTLSRRDGGSHPLAGRIERMPYDFDEAALAAALDGVETVYVTYWMRFPRGETTWGEMVENVGRLARASVAAGVRRLVYVSVSNASHDSSTAYFRAKAAAEDMIRASGVSHAIVRPTLLYGPADILINNMAWTLRRLPVFGIPGDGEYRVQPVHVDDVAELSIRLGASDEAADVFAAGPEVLTFNELTRVVRAAVGSRALVTHMPPTLVLAATRVVGVLVRDVVLTRDEIRELTESLLVADDPAGTCPTRITEWLAANRESVGRSWSSELGRNFRLADLPSIAASR